MLLASLPTVVEAAVPGACCLAGLWTFLPLGILAFMAPKKRPAARGVEQGGGGQQNPGESAGSAVRARRAHLGFDGGRVPQLARSQVSIFDPSLRRWLPLQVVWVRAGFAVLVASRTRCTFSKVESRCLWARYLGLPANGAKCTVPALSAGAFGLHVAFVLFTLPLVYRVALNVSVFVCRGYGGAIAMPGYTDPAKELLWWWHPEKKNLFKPHVR